MSQVMSDVCDKASVCMLVMDQPQHAVEIRSAIALYSKIGLLCTIAV